MSNIQCLEQCHTLVLSAPMPEVINEADRSAITAAVIARRQQLLDHCAQLGIDTLCQGSRIGLMHPICGMNNDAKTAIERTSGRRPDLNRRAV